MEQEINPELEAAIKTLFRHVNYGGKDVSRAIIKHLETEHRTLEQGFFRAIKEVCGDYRQFAFDLRNESAVRFAQKVSEIDEYMPFI